jgi:preprotein translocase subunit SecG
MALFNRIIAVLLFLLVAVAAAVALLVIFGWLQPEQVAGAAWVQNALFSLAERGRPLNWVSPVLALVFIGAIVLLALELRPRSREPERVVLRQDQSGTLAVSRESIAELVRREATRIPDVTDAHSQIETGAEGLRIFCHVTVQPGASMAGVGEELHRRIREAVERYLGTPISELHLDARVAPRSSRARRVA